MKNKPHKLWVLFLTTLYISAFTFGGGFVIVTFMKHKFVDELHWIDELEMLVDKSMWPMPSYGDLIFEV